MVLLAIGVGVAVLAVAGDASSSPQPALAGKLWAMSQRVAVANGDPAAYDRWAVGPVSRARAVRVTSGDIVEDSSPSYVIEMRGNFTCDSCSIPAGGSAPRGRVLTLVVSASGLVGTDFGLTPGWSALSRLGTPFPLHKH